MVQTRLHKHSLSKAEQAVSNVASRASVRDPIDEFQEVYGSRAASAAFRQQLGSDFSSSPQIQPPIQAKPSFRGLSQELAAESQPVQLREEENKTGLPDDLKAGVESLSGFSLDDVRVHYNSPKPAQLQALAYTQGTEIHVGPGQEKHLAHEAWHVVQQMQGRVKPTMQAVGNDINDDELLEKEAEIKGYEADKPRIENRTETKPVVPPHKVAQRYIYSPNGHPLSDSEIQHWYSAQPDTLFSTYRHHRHLEKIVKHPTLHIYMANYLGIDNPGEQFEKDMNLLSKETGMEESERMINLLHPSQTAVIQLLGQLAQSYKEKIPSNIAKKFRRKGDFILPEAIYKRIREAAEALSKLAANAYPGDILSPEALDERNPQRDTVIRTLQLADTFLSNLLTTFNSDEANDYILAYIPILDLITSNTGKQCITSLGADVFRLFNDRVIVKLS